MFPVTREAVPFQKLPPYQYIASATELTVSHLHPKIQACWRACENVARDVYIKKIRNSTWESEVKSETTVAWK